MDNYTVQGALEKYLQILSLLHELVCSFSLVYSYKMFFICQVFDGHGGKHAADFACNYLPRFIIEDVDFPGEIERVVASAFHQTDAAFAEACSTNAGLASGTTALAALVVGRLGFSCI